MFDRTKFSLDALASLDLDATLLLIDFSPLKKTRGTYRNVKENSKNSQSLFRINAEEKGNFEVINNFDFVSFNVFFNIRSYCRNGRVQ